MSFNSIIQPDIQRVAGEIYVHIPHCVKLVKATVNEDEYSKDLSLLLLCGDGFPCVSRKIVLVDLSYPAGLIESIDKQWNEYLGNDVSNNYAIFIVADD